MVYNIISISESRLNKRKVHPLYSEVVKCGGINSFSEILLSEGTTNELKGIIT